MGDPLKRIAKKTEKAKARAALIKARESNKNQKAGNKNVRSVKKAAAAAAAAALLKKKKDDQAKRAQETIKSVRSKEKNINVKGDRRLVGNDTKINKTKVTQNSNNTTKNKSTSTSSSSSASQKQKQKQKPGEKKRRKIIKVIPLPPRKPKPTPKRKGPVRRKRPLPPVNKRNPGKA